MFGGGRGYPKIFATVGAHISTSLGKTRPSFCRGYTCTAVFGSDNSQTKLIALEIKQVTPAPSFCSAGHSAP